MNLFLRDYARRFETGVPVTPPSAYRKQMGHHSTRQTAVSLVTIATLWLAVHADVGILVTALSGELQTPFCLGS